MRHTVLASLTFLFTVLLAPHAASAQDRTDHPLLSRMPGFEVAEKQTKDFDSLELETFQVVGAQPPSVPLRYEGKITTIKYVDVGESKSNLQIYMNHEAALLKAGATYLNKGVVRDSDGVRLGHHVFRMKAAGNAAPMHVLLYINSPQWYSLTFVEPAALVQEITAGQLADELKTQGYATLHIEFDTGKSVLKPDGEAAVKAIVSLLKAQVSLKLAVEGHTDNVGGAAANKQLSLARADAVVRAVVAQGIEPQRLRAVGHGQEAPIADNRQDAGRAKNRRVELVPQK